MSGNVWECLGMSGNARKCKRMSGNAGSVQKCREMFGKCPEMFGNVWKCPEMSGSERKCLKMSGNVRNARRQKKRSSLLLFLLLLVLSAAPGERRRKGRKTLLFWFFSREKKQTRALFAQFILLGSGTNNRRSEPGHFHFVILLADLSKEKRSAKPGASFFFKSLEGLLDFWGVNIDIFGFSILTALGFNIDTRSGSIL